MARLTGIFGPLWYGGAVDDCEVRCGPTQGMGWPFLFVLMHRFELGLLIYSVLVYFDWSRYGR